MKEILDFFNDIKTINYGWHDKDGNIHESLKDFKDNFQLQDINKILEDRYAVCWEMCEVQKDFFNKKEIENKTIFAFLDKSKNYANHTFSVFFMNGKCFWFEASWKSKKGIHEFNSLEEVLEYFRNNFIDFSKVEYDKNNMRFFEYENNNAVDSENFIKYCLSSKEL